MISPNLYTWGNGWLFHPKIHPFLNWFVWGSRNPEPTDNLSTPPVEKDQLRVDLSSNPARFWISKIYPKKIGTKCCALLANPKNCWQKTLKGTVAPVFFVKGLFSFFGEAPQRLKAKGFQNRLVSLKSPKEPKAPETLNSPARLFFPEATGTLTQLHGLHHLRIQ